MKKRGKIAWRLRQERLKAPSTIFSWFSRISTGQTLSVLFSVLALLLTWRQIIILERQTEILTLQATAQQSDQIDKVRDQVRAASELRDELFRLKFQLLTVQIRPCADACRSHTLLAVLDDAPFGGTTNKDVAALSSVEYMKKQLAGFIFYVEPGMTLSKLQNVSAMWLPSALKDIYGDALLRCAPSSSTADQIMLRVRAIAQIAHLLNVHADPIRREFDLVALWDTGLIDQKKPQSFDWQPEAYTVAELHTDTHALFLSVREETDMLLADCSAQVESNLRLLRALTSRKGTSNDISSSYQIDRPSRSNRP